MFDDVRERFEANLARVASLVDLHGKLVELRGRWSGKETPTLVHDDLLRAAVVLLHAALEDLLRSIEEWLLPRRGEKALNEILIPLRRDTGRRVDRIRLGQLAYYKGQSVDDVIRQALEAHFEVSTYSNIMDLNDFLRRNDLRVEWQDPEKLLLMGMMKRRHLIAHRADRNRKKGSGHHRITAIDTEMVETWCEAVRWFGEQVLAAAEGIDGEAL